MTFLTPQDAGSPAPTTAAAAPGVSVPSNIEALRASTPPTRAEKLYDAAPPAPLAQFVEANSDPTAPRASVQAVALEITAMAKDCGLDDGELAAMMNRAPAAQKLAPDEAQRAQRKAMDLLRAEHGPEGADKALAEAKRLIARDPRMANFMQRSGLGNDPETVALFARKARTQRGMGRLR